MAIEIHALTKSDIPVAIDCVQRAFADDPFFLWLFNDPTTFNPKRNAASLTAHYLHGLALAAPVFVAKEVLEKEKEKENESSSKLLGVSVWIPPSPLPAPPQPWSAWVHDWILSLRQLMNIIRFAGWGGLNVRRYRIWKARQAAAQAKLWSDARGYYFCNVVAVSEEARGKGVGRRLIEAVTKRADEEGMPCYLESSKLVPNVGIYERLGFEVVGEIECVDGEEGMKPKMKA